MSIEEARGLLWEIVVLMDDEELQAFIIECQRMVSIIMNFAEEEATEK